MPSFAARQRVGIIVERAYIDMTTDIKFMVTKSVVTLQ